MRITIEMEAKIMYFDDLAVDADHLRAAVNDPEHFYRFINDGESVTIEKYDMRSVESMVRP